ncbi:MAG: DEAD/DEAH box helicase [Candidatus Poseidoniaceae archaeon]|nr:DEAD/DEAH box helicase [Candidatus Poseidoniaceae archaeon]
MSAQHHEVMSLDLPEKAKIFLSEVWGIKKLHPPQSEAMPAVLSGSNTLLAIPTASGKSLIAYIGIMRKLLVDDIGSKAVYIVPLKALASEKYDDLKQLGNHLGLKVGLGIGDSVREVANIESCDILVCTSEKLDSMMRSNSDIVANVSIVIADEFHLMNDSSRGPTLEINLTRLRYLRPKSQVIALSATVGNCIELSQWLDATLIQSEWRPVALEYSTFHDLHIEPRMVQSSQIGEDNAKLNPPRDIDGPKSHPTGAIVIDSLAQDGQLLVFVGTRRSAQSEAHSLAKRVKKVLSKQDPERLEKLQQLVAKLSRNTQSSMGESLCEAISGGVAFHHAGLTHTQRKEIESAFKQGLLVALTATPTLAAGVNLPARRVLVRDIKRWDDGMSRPLPVMEIRQMLGRAGRPKYDDFGEAWILCKGTDGWEIADEVSDKYFFGPIENITSKLASEPAMRMHLLSMITSGGMQHRLSIIDFFKATFLGYCMPTIVLEERLDKMIHWLVEERFIRRVGIDEHFSVSHNIKQQSEDISMSETHMPAWAKMADSTGGVEFHNEVQDYSNKSYSERISAHSQASLGFTNASTLRTVGGWKDEVKNDDLAMKYEATIMGERITQFYLDPLSASILRHGMRRAIRRMVRGNAPVTDFGLLHLASATPDFSSLWAKTKDMVQGSPLWVKTNSVEDEMLHDSSYEERLLGYVKSAWMLEMWMDENTMREIEAALDVTPGDVNYRVDTISWLMAGAQAILMADDVFSDEHMEHISELSIQIDIVKQRVRHGCKKDLLQLVNIRTVGRKRARELASMGYRSVKSLAAMSKKEIKTLSSKRGWGPKIVDNMLIEVGKIIKPKKQIIDTEKIREDDIPLDDENYPVD